MRAGPLALVTLLCLGCGSRGQVTFSILAPRYQPLNPITGQVTEYAVRRLDGAAVAVAFPTPDTGGTLSLGPLMQSPTPVDLEFEVMSGANLLGMARVQDVAIENGVQKEYAVYVRKPLITIGSDLPRSISESIPGNAVQPGKIIDPTNSDVEVADLTTLPGGPRMPP